MAHYALQLACFLYFLVLSPGTSGDYCKLQEYYIIRNEGSRLVLEANDVTRAVTIEAYTGTAPQLWVIENGIKPGFFFIINKKNGKVLDVGRENRIEVNCRSKSLSQQWYIHQNGFIANVQYERVLDVVGGDYRQGNAIQLWDMNGTGAQKYLLQTLDSQLV